MPEPAFKTGSIHIIDSLPAGGLRTGENAFEEAQTLGFSLQPNIGVHYWREPRSSDVINRLATIADTVVATARAPIIHFEAHGSTEGLQTSSGEFLGWEDLRIPLAKINILCRLNLLVLVEACDGEALAKVVQLTDRAPVWGLIGPKRPVSFGEIDDANRAFYRTMARTKDGALALRAMNETVKAADNPFSFIGAEMMFRAVMKRYFKEMCTSGMIEQRADKVIAEFINSGANAEVVGSLRTSLRDHIGDHRALFDAVRSRFFFTDLCPDHEQRFRTLFEDCAPPES